MILVIGGKYIRYMYTVHLSYEMQLSNILLYLYGSISLIHNIFQIIDMESGNSLGPNENGELCVRGPIVTKVGN